MRKLTRKSLVRLCDKEMSLYVRGRDKMCVICGTRENLTCGHLMSRVAYSTRWLLDNCFTQCASCNLRHEYNPHPFVAWYVHMFGWDKYEALIRRHSQTSKLTSADLEAILIEIKAMRDTTKEAS